MKKSRVDFYVIFTLLLLLLQGCAKMCDCNDPKLTYDLVENNSDILHLDGYYYGRSLYPNNIEGDSIYKCYFLYQNGIAYDTYGKNSIDASQGKINITTSPDDKTIWLIYILSEDEVILQGWEPSMNCSLTLVTLKGKVLSDTTFTIEYKAGNDEQLRKLDKPILYTFVPYANKPDSTNIFIP